MATYSLVSGDFVATGGMDRANLALASYLGRMGAEVRCVSHRVAPELLAMPNVHFVRVPRPARSDLLASPLLDAAGQLEATRARRAGGSVVVNGGNCIAPAVNWVHYVHAAFTPRAVTAGALRRAKVLVSHQYFLHQERRALLRAPLVVTNSERTRVDVVERIGVPAERVRVVYYGIDPEAFRPATAEERRAARESLAWPSDRLTALFIGALGDQRKGFDTLYAAWRQLLRASDWDVDLAVVGTGPQLQHWRARAEQEGLSGSIRFLGFRKDVPRLLAAGDVLIAPTRYEAYGLGVHEALCTGLPALVTRSAGVAERYPPTLSPLLLDGADDPEELVHRLRDWRRSEPRFRAWTQELSGTLRRHTWDDMARQIAQLVELSRDRSGSGSARRPQGP